MQGYYLGRPMDGAKVLTMLRAQAQTVRRRRAARSVAR
jgi:EAL domain-containing protein (putative c-di-GMP-specific phosphodiesterase class I)